MANYMEYSQIKQLINEYWILKREEKYDEFIKKLTDILKI